MGVPTQSDYEHIEHLQNETKHLIESKYLTGIKEHGGHLWEKPVEREALAEAIDQVSYLITLRDQIDEVCKLALKGLDKEMDARTACFHIIQTLGRVCDHEKPEPETSKEGPEV
jgi:hypothetical protein